MLENKYACKFVQTVVHGNKKGTLRRFPQRVYMMNPIQYQRDGQHDGACADQNIGYGDRDADPEYMDKHGEIEQDRGRFAVPVRSKDRPCLVDDQDAGDAHEQFLEDHDDNQDQHKRITADQADQHGDLCKLVCHRVEDLAQIADCVKMSGDKAVGHICQAGEQEQQPGGSIVFLQVLMDKDRDQQEPEQRQ